MVGPCVELGSVTTFSAVLSPLCKLKRREGVGNGVYSPTCSTHSVLSLIRSSRGLTIPQSGIRCGGARIDGVQSSQCGS